MYSIESLEEKYGTKVFEYALGEDNAKVYFKVPDRKVGSRVLHFMLDEKSMNAVDLIMETCLLKEESDKRITTDIRPIDKVIEYDALYYGARTLAMNLIQIALPQVAEEIKKK